MLNFINSSTKKAAVLKSLDASMLRSRTIANNIANVTTPGFRRTEVSFEDELRSALDSNKLKGTRTNGAHMQLGKGSIASVSPRAYKPVDPTLPSGVNNVDIDTEMSKLAENQLKYTMGIKFLKVGYSQINAAISGKAIQ